MPRPTAAIAGVFAALVTPRKGTSSEVDVGAFLDYIGFLESTGINGFVLFGSTGEFVHFDLSERIHAASLALRRARVPTLVNVSHSDLAGTLTLAENAIDSGAAGILVMPPYFYRYDQPAIETFYDAVAGLFNSQTKVFLYHLPQHTNPIGTDLARRLLASGRFAGIKDSSGDPALFQALAEQRQTTPFIHLAGNERTYGAARKEGVDGIISGVAAALPELMLAWDAALVSKDEAASDRLQAQVHQYLDWLDRFPATVLIRQTAALRGHVSAQPSVPLSPEQKQLLDQFRRWFETNSWRP